MNIQSIPDIPKLYTSIAEWAACVIYILPLKKRIGTPLLSLMLIVFFGLILGVQYVSGTLPIMFWIPGMLTAMFCMYLFIYFCCDISALDAGYCFARAFIAAEFAASLEWQIYYWLLERGINSSQLISAAIMILIYGVVFIAIYFIDAYRLPGNMRLGVRVRELGSAMLMAFATFLMSNFNFVFKDSLFGNSAGAGILYIRTLVDFSGLTMLFAQQEQRGELQLKGELDAMNNVLKRQYEQYQQSKENIELLNLKYHDLKHMIGAIRREEDPEKKETYLADMDEAITIYEAQNKTGNHVLDTVLTGKSLYCAKHDISLVCAADGSNLGFMSTMDICTIFGNALDNAIESVEKLPDKEKRSIRVSTFTQNNFLMMRFENYFEKDLSFYEGLPQTTKKDRKYHGYGIKSIQRTTEKYGGNITIHTDDNWFVFLILIPLPTGKSGNIQ